MGWSWLAAAALALVLLVPPSAAAAAEGCAGTMLPGAPSRPCVVNDFLAASPHEVGARLLPESRVRLVRDLIFTSQLTEAPPAYWRRPLTPYCAAAASIMVMRDLGIAHGDEALARTFAIGRRGNTTADLGLDPDGIAHLMRAYGGDGRIHVYRSMYVFVNELVGRLNHGVAVVALTKAGDHAVTVFGYEAVPGGDVTALYVADPLSGFYDRVGIDDWFTSPHWMGQRFSAPGRQWQRAYVFVSYRDH